MRHHLNSLLYLKSLLKISVHQKFRDRGRIVWLIAPELQCQTAKIFSYTIVIIIIVGGVSDLFLNFRSSFYHGDIWLWSNINFNHWYLAKR